MAGSESIQKALTRVRPPRVKITYDVEIGDAIEKRELPFVVGILADLSGENAPEAPLKDRKFIEIDRDNFDDVLKSIAPRVGFKVKDKFSATPEADISIAASFTTFDDFRPENLVKNLPALQALLDKRNKLRDLLTKTDGNDNWAKLLDQTVDKNEVVTKALPKPNGAVIDATPVAAEPAAPEGTTPPPAEHPTTS